jgi:hypothetical protein
MAPTREVIVNDGDTGDESKPNLMPSAYHIPVTAWRNGDRAQPFNRP